MTNRIYIGANTNKVLVFDLRGNYIDNIDLDDNIKVKKLIIIDVSNSFGNELIIQTCDDSVLFSKVASLMFGLKMSQSEFMIGF